MTTAFDLHWSLAGNKTRKSRLTAKGERMSSRPMILICGAFSITSLKINGQPTIVERSETESGLTEQVEFCWEDVWNWAISSR